MECPVTSPPRMYQRPGFRAFSGVMCFHAQIKPQQEIIEIKTKSNSVCCGKLFIERSESEESSLLVCIVTYSPYITDIDKYTKLYNPEKFSSVFRTQDKPDVTALIHEVTHAVDTTERPRSESAHGPATDSIGSPSIEPLLKRKNTRIAVWNSDPEAHSCSHRLAFIETMG